MNFIRLLTGFVATALILSAMADTRAADDQGADRNMRRIDMRIDVTGSVDLPGKIEIAATAFLPEPRLMGSRPIVMFALPGGGLTRHYYDVHIPGHEGYSEAKHHTDRGIVVVAVDHLGVGDSTTTSLETMRIEDIARANDAAVEEISRRLEQGEITEGFPPLPGFFSLGVGQSMGGGVTIIMQGRHHSYDAIAVLGYSAIHTVLPQPTEADRRRIMELESYHNGRWTDPETLSFEEAVRADIDHAYVGFWDDVPQDIIDAKLKHGYPQSTDGANWVSRTVPNCVIGMMSPGFVATEAAEVRVPVFLGLGERDVVPNPLAEAAAYQSTQDFSVYIVPQLGHTHNLGNTRQQLWDRLVAWAKTVSEDA